MSGRKNKRVDRVIGAEEVKSLAQGVRSKISFPMVSRGSELDPRD